jgi:phosphoserine phosphatase
MEALNDLDYGQWQWRTYDEVQAAWPELFAAWRTAPHLVRLPEGDSLQDLVARTANALRFVLNRHVSKTDTVWGMTASIEPCSCSFSINPSAYWRIAQEPYAINEIEIFDGRICVQRMNETQHLEAIL